MIVTVNGERRELPRRRDGRAASSSSLGGDPEGRGVAVAVGGEVVPRGAWAQTELRRRRPGRGRRRGSGRMTG